MKKKRKGITGGIYRCPYCGSSVTYRSADGIYRNNSRKTMLYVCSHYPECGNVNKSAVEIYPKFLKLGAVPHFV